MRDEQCIVGLARACDHLGTITNHVHARSPRVPVLYTHLPLSRDTRDDVTIVRTRHAYEVCSVDVTGRGEARGFYSWRGVMGGELSPKLLIRFISSDNMLSILFKEEAQRHKNIL